MSKRQHISRIVGLSDITDLLRTYRHLNITLDAFRLLFTLWELLGLAFGRLYSTSAQSFAMCGETIRVYTNCTGKHLQPGQGLQVGNARRHYFKELAMCEAKKSAVLNGQPLNFCTQFPQFTNLNTGTRIKVPSLSGSPFLTSLEPLTKVWAIGH